MSGDKDIELRMRLVRETDRAMLVAGNGREEWIPRSLVAYRKREGFSDEVTFTLPTWKVEKSDLWEFAIT